MVADAPTSPPGCSGSFAFRSGFRLRTAIAKFLDAADKCERFVETTLFAPCLAARWLLRAGHYGNPYADLRERA
jgi:hypothetical protein